jgi:hypothetical protein
VIERVLGSIKLNYPELTKNTNHLMVSRALANFANTLPPAR